MEVQKILREGIPAEILALTGGILAGLGLAAMRDLLQQVPGLIVMIPAFLGMRGDIATSLASRLGTALHSGTMRPEYEYSEETKDEIVGTFILNIVEATLIGILTYFVTVSLESQKSSLILLLGISILACIMSSGITIPITFFSAIFFYRRNIDPDTVMSPYLATFGDIVSLFALYLVTRLMIGGG